MYVSLPNISADVMQSHKTLFLGSRGLGNFNHIPPELWNDVITWVGAIMARTDFRLSKVTKRPPSTQNLFPNKYFDL